MVDVANALDNLRVHQRQLDADGVMVGVSRQALNEVIRHCGKVDARIAALEAQLAEARKALGMMLKEHDILSGNFGDVMDPKHKRPDRWPTAAEAARRALEGGE